MDKDNVFLQNSDYHRSDLVLSIQLITLIPREGTETGTGWALFFPACEQLITLIPREGTETLLMTPKPDLSFRVDYPYSPRGDGNPGKEVTRTDNKLLITLIPREGTETIQ